MSQSLLSKNKSLGRRYEHRWPEGAVIYQIYPRSFQDENGDGVGDLPGIISRLDYLRDLGVDAVWLSPFYPSPMADFGYDIADFCDVDPLFGTLQDFDALVAAAHTRGIRILVDLVPNHTSDQHSWFIQSSRSDDNPYADWYVWRDPHPSSTPGNPLPPNNWLSALTADSAWEWSEARGQFYLHSFDKSQPDLNWMNPRVRDAMKQVMRFWLDHGVDGFRVDAVYWLAKDPLFRDDPLSDRYVEGRDHRYDSLSHDSSSGWPGVYAHLNSLAGVLKEPAYRARQPFMLTEAYPDRHNPVTDYMTFYEGVDPEVAAPFNFEGLSLPWRAGDWRLFLTSFHRALREQDPNSIASYAFGNHDKSRLVSRIGQSQARAAAVMQLTLPGVAIVYYGEEIGMQDVALSPEYVRDPGAKGGIGRDPQRTFMQWSDSPQAGATTSTRPWLPLASGFAHHNVETELADSASSLHLYKQLIRLRHTQRAMQRGDFRMVDVRHPQCLGFIRFDEDACYLTLVNFSSTQAECSVLPGGYRGELSSRPDSLLTGTDVGSDVTVIALQPHEAAVFAVTSRHYLQTQ